jgi:hypothetical protein
MNFKTLCRAAAILACSVAIQAQATPITTLYNTGVNNAGTVLANATLNDPHYVLTSVAGNSTTQTRIRTSVGGYPIPPYLGDNALSAWIGPNNSNDLSGPVGNFIYSTTFDLTGFDLNTVSIAGLWSSDNQGLDILINGVSLGFTSANTQFAIGFASFLINSNFVSGINTIDFVIFNDGGPTALRTQMIGTGDLQAVPEPESIALLGLGLVAISFARKRKQA